MKRTIPVLFLIATVFLVISFSKDLLKLGYPLKYPDTVIPVSERYGLDPLLILSIMRAESKYDEYALSYANAKGLMQLTDDTFDVIRNNIASKDDIFDPVTNITGGIWYLYYLYQNTDDIKKAVEAYNCGLMNVGRMIPQSVIYTRRVFEFYEIYQNLYSDRSFK